ncbi:hypothetical protein N9933_03525 [bacterium]|nr:hypothetical protein [bacterium]
MDFRILDPQSRSVISQKKFPGTFIWSDRWGYFNGDERALTQQDRDCLRKDREVPSPSPQILFREFTQPIYNQVTGFVGNFYQRY